MPPKSSTLRVTAIGCLSLAVAMGVGRFAFTPLLPLMQDDGLLGIADGGLLASGHFLGYLLGALFAGRIASAPRSTLKLALVAIGVSTLLMGVTQNFMAWIVLRWLCGAASALVLVLIGDFYLRHLSQVGRAACHGWVFSGVGAGIAVVGLACLALMRMQIPSLQSWQIIGAASLLAAWAICLSIGPEIPPVRRLAEAGSAPSRPLAWPLIVAYGAAGVGYVIPATYLPIMARETVQSPLIFGLSWPIFGLAAFISTPLAAKLRQQSTNRQVWAVSQLVMALGLLLPVVYPHILSIVAAAICVGGTFMIITMAGLKEAHQITSPQDTARHIAVMTTAFATGQMVGPLFAGYIHALTHTFTAPLVSTSAALALTATMLMRREATEEPTPL